MNKVSENNVQAGKLNELVGFLVSSLNDFGSRQQVNDQLKKLEQALALKGFSPAPKYYIQP